MKGIRIGIAASLLTAAVALGMSSTATARDCTLENHCADISVTGYAAPQPVRRGDRTTLVVTAQNNGPSNSKNDWVQALVPGELIVKKVSISGDGNAEGCENNGYGFIKCKTGDLSKNEQSVMKIKVRAKKRGTYSVDIQAWADGNTFDPNQSSNYGHIKVGVS